MSPGADLEAGESQGRGCQGLRAREGLVSKAEMRGSVSLLCGEGI